MLNFSNLEHTLKQNMHETRISIKAAQKCVLFDREGCNTILLPAKLKKNIEMFQLHSSSPIIHQ